MNDQQHSLRAVALACVLATAALAGCGGDSAQDHLAKAKASIEKQDHKAAIIELKNTLQADPKIAEARYLLGRELLEQGDPRNAEIELQKAVDARYDLDRSLPLLVRAEMLQGQVDNVLKQVEQAKLSSPAANAELQTLLGITQFGRRRYDDASKAFAEARRLVPDYVEARLGEARVKATQGDLTAAATEVSEVLAKEPKNVDALILQGDIARANAKQPDAIAAYEAALKQNPRNFLARINLANMLIATGQIDAAQQHLDELKKVAPKHPGVTYVDALIAFNKKDFARANAAITMSLNVAPANAAAQLLAGSIATASNEPAQAEAHLREAVKLNPANPFARKLLASLYLRQRQPAKADEVLQPALAAAPNDASLVSIAGEIALMKGDYNSASQSFDRATKLNPNDAAVRTQSAALSFARGDADAGFAELEAASKVATTNPNPDIALVLAHLQRREWDKAAAAWKTLEKRQPANPIVYNLRAAIDMGKNDPAAARASLERALQIQPGYFPAVANLAGMDLAEKNVEGARARYKKLLEKDPSNLSGYLALAQLENANGATQETVVHLLQEAKRTNPGSEAPSIALIGYYANRNDPKQALRIAQEALSASPNSPRYLDLAGQLLLQSGSVDQAVAAYRKLVTVNPEIVESQIKLGEAQLRAGQNEAALQTFGNALKQRSDSVVAQSTVVTALIRANRADDAARMLGEIKQASPKSPAIPELDADVKMASGKYADAAAQYRKVIATTPSPNLIVKTYSALALAGKRNEGDAFLADWVKAHPRDLQVRVFDADVALRMKDFKRAVQNYRVVLDARPNDPMMLNNLAWALSQEKDPQALSYAEKAKSLAPENPAINDTLGWMLVEQGQVARGVELLQKANANAPEQRDIALHLAKAQMKNGKKDAAKTVLEKLVKSAPPESAEAKESKELLAQL